MESSADLTDTAFQLSCMRCNQLMHDGERFCRLCGQDQLDTGLDPWASRPAPLAGTGWRPAAEQVAPPPAALLSAAARVPAAAAVAPEPPARHPAARTVPARVAIGVATVVVLALTLALVHDLYRTRQDEAARRAQLDAALEQVESAIARGDIADAQHKLSVMTALGLGDPEAQARRQAFEARLQALTAERGRLRASAAASATAPVPLRARAATPAVTAAEPEPTSASASAPALTPALVPAPVDASEFAAPATPAAVSAPAVAARPPEPAGSPPPSPALQPAPALTAASVSPVLADAPADDPVPSLPERAGVPADGPASTTPPGTCHQALAAMALCSGG